MKYLFLKLDVCTYICVMKLEEAIQSTTFSSQKQKAGLNILYTAWWVKTIVNRELKTLGLTGEQFNVLRILKGKHPAQMCVRDIGCRMIEKNSNVPRIIDRLELKKLVNRSTSAIDKRETVISLTTVGIDLLKISTTRVDKLFAQTINITESDSDQLNRLLEKVRESE